MGYLKKSSCKTILRDHYPLLYMLLDMNRFSSSKANNIKPHTYCVSISEVVVL